MTGYRTAKGDLSAKLLKAMQWYSIEHGLKLTASSPFPIVWFKNQDDGINKVHMDDIMEAYEAFKKSTHGKRKTAA
ncbi:hypothetical protein [uncultured Kocuria sp.]|uniref:hypothetical protein n=1 Tax=uncultured Kocuria sp. TaxID=259305 RepID=UPI00262A2A35|nr:hypothetical protein [uncultured Kocuria sp.]